MRKSCFVILGMLIITSLLGCSSLKETKAVPSETTEVQIDSEKNVEEIEETEEPKEKDISNVQVENKDKTDDFQLVSSGDYTKLILINVADKTELNTYELNKNEFYYANNIFQFSNGYAAIIRNSESGTTNFISFDEGLNVVKNINLSDEVDQEILNNGIEMALSQDGNMLVWSFGFKLYYYSVADKSKGYLIEKTQDDIAFQKIRFISNDKLAYIGSSVAEKEGDSCVGLYNISDESIEKYPISNYKAAGLSFNGNYVCVTDYIEKSSGKSSGTVVLLNLEKSQLLTVHVDEYGSTMACVSKDGKYVFAVNDVAEADEYYIMQYNVEDNTLVNKYPLEFDTDIRITSLKCNSDDSQVFVEYYTGEKFDIQSISYEK